MKKSLNGEKMTDEFDLMVDNTFEQQFRKPRKDLRNVPKYKKDEYLGDEDFNTAYITPNNITITDLLPDEYEEKNINEIGNNFGSFGLTTKNISVANKKAHDELKNASNNIYDPRFFGYYPSLIHENSHKMFDKKYRQNSCDAYDINYNRMRNDNLSRNNKFDETISKDLELMNTTINSPTKNNEKYLILYNDKSIYANRFVDEPLARFAGAYPEEIINPTTKTGKRLNRIWFE